MTRIVRVTVAEDCFRVISTRYPTIELFDDVSDAEDFENLYELQAMTNPRLQGKTISASNYIAAAFAYINPEGSRFTDGAYGVYYAGANESVSIAETVYHTQRFLSETCEPAQNIDKRVIKARLDAKLHNIANKQPEFPHYYRDTDYRYSQAFARDLFNDSSDGIRYSSVRDPDNGYAFAVFNPDSLSKPRQTKHLVYDWDGSAIVDVFQKRLVS